jgi:hypothetical protein
LRRRRVRQRGGGAVADLGAADLDDALIGVERDPLEAAKAQALAPTARIITSNFLDLDPSALPAVDAVIGNPPYIRYHGFVGSDRDKGLAPATWASRTRLASSWAPFIDSAVGSRHGHPAELLPHGGTVRDLLMRRFGSVLIAHSTEPCSVRRSTRSWCSPRT